MTVAALQETFEALLAARVGPEAARWLESARAAAAASSLDPMLALYSAAAIRVGRAPLALSAAEHALLAGLLPGLSFERWTIDDVARALLLMARREAGRTDDDFVADATACFEHADAREQQSWLRAVSMWPESARFLPTVIDACRTNIVPVFESIACENPYPGRHFPERNFNQVILKALFNSIALSRVVGLAGRINPELSRMARDYAAERTAAGRSVPADIAMAIGADAGGQEQPS